jgi:hypothetical protein
MSKKTPSQDLNSKIEAKKIDDWFFQEKPINKGEKIMTMWKKLKSTLTMKIPGPTWTLFLMVASLGTITVLFTVLPTGLPEKNTLEESTFGQNESLDLLLKVEKEGELQLKVTGANTTVVVQNLLQMLRSMDETRLLDKSSPYTLHQVR